MPYKKIQLTISAFFFFNINATCSRVLTLVQVYISPGGVKEGGGGIFNKDLPVYLEAPLAGPRLYPFTYVHDVPFITEKVTAVTYIYQRLTNT